MVIFHSFLYVYQRVSLLAVVILRMLIYGTLAVWKTFTIHCITRRKVTLEAPGVVTVGIWLYSQGLSSGKRLHNELKNHYAFNG